MSEKHPCQLTQTALLSHVGTLVYSVGHFAEEYGELVLHGLPLPPGAAEELSAMIRCSRDVRESLVHLRKTSPG
jgi:hypothetical protein